MPEENKLTDLIRRVEELESVFNIRPNEILATKNMRFDGGPILKGVFFVGRITSAGVATYLPTGWTSAKNATGKYTITHNLQTTNYGVVLSTTSTLATEHDLNTLTSTAFSIELLLNGTFADGAFNFILVKY